MGSNGVISVTIAIFALCSCKTDALNPLSAQAQAIAPQKKITYKIQDYCAAPGQSLSSLFVINASYKILGGEIQIDSDRDGIPDRLDNNPFLGISRYSADSNHNSFGDLAIFTLGLSQSAQAAITGFSTCDNPGLDSDGDGLSDCTETILTKTNPHAFDTDSDGIPDELELRFGLNPLDKADGNLSPAGDGMTALQKIKAQLPVRETVTPNTAQYAHHYQLVPSQLSQDGNHCYDMTVTDIPIVSVPNGNLMISYIMDKANSNVGAGAHRCCSIVPSAIDDGSLVTVKWASSPELICPCPLDLDVHG